MSQSDVWANTRRGLVFSSVRYYGYVTDTLEILAFLFAERVAILSLSFSLEMHGTLCFMIGLRDLRGYCFLSRARVTYMKYSPKSRFFFSFNKNISVVFPFILKYQRIFAQAVTVCVPILEHYHNDPNFFFFLVKIKVERRSKKSKPIKDKRRIHIGAKSKREEEGEGLRNYGEFHIFYLRLICCVTSTTCLLSKTHKRTFLSLVWTATEFRNIEVSINALSLN